MNTYALDFETYYDKECSIQVLGPLGYFNHHDFDAYRVSVWGDEGTQFVGHPKDFEWEKLKENRVLSHNASFDETLYFVGVEKGWWPKVDFAEWHCTADLAAYCRLPRSLKGSTTELFNLEISKETRDNMSGKKWEDMSEEFQKEVDDYALKDSELCLKLWEELSPKWPDFERAISSTNRRIVQRGIPIDMQLLEDNKNVVANKLFDAEKSIPWFGEKPTLSRIAFNEECRKVGIEPPASLALADEEAEEFVNKYGEKYPFILAVRDYRRLNALLKKIKSFENATIEDLRYYGGCLYFGAHTGRYSGSGGNLNLQNLPRAEHFGVNLRHMLRAPKGYKFIIADLSQIEVRTLCWLARDMKVLEQIKKSDDIYEVFASQLGFWEEGKEGFKKAEGGKLRHKVKQIVLGCGYGVSGKKFAMISGFEEEQAQEYVEKYRNSMDSVVRLWRKYQHKMIAAWHAEVKRIKENKIKKDNNRPTDDVQRVFQIKLPSGRVLDYGEVKLDEGEERQNWVVHQFKHNKKVPMRAWGGLLTENASQALSRDIFSDMMLRLEEAGIKIIFHVHDEFIIEVEEKKAEQTLEQVLDIMSTAPDWIADIPLEAEGKIVNRYQK